MTDAAWTHAACSRSARSRTAARSRARPRRWRSRSRRCPSSSPRSSASSARACSTAAPAAWRRPRPARVLLAHADALADRLALAGSQLGELVGAEARRLRLGAFPSALATIVPAAIARMREAEPELEVSVVDDSSPVLAERVGEGELHLAVCFQDAAIERREHPGTTRHDLLEEPMVAALPPGHRLARRKSIRVTDLAEDVWTAPSASGLLVRYCADHGFEPRIAFLTSDVLASQALVAGGHCVTLVPRLDLGGHAGRRGGAGAGPAAAQPLRRAARRRRAPVRAHDARRAGGGHGHCAGRQRHTGIGSLSPLIRLRPASDHEKPSSPASSRTAPVVSTLEARARAVSRAATLTVGPYQSP